MGVGRRLQQAREARGLSLAQVASRTKIPSRQLSLLEAEDYARLPPGIFIRGFLRATAGVVGLDPDELVRQFQEETGPPAPATADISPPGPVPPGRGIRFRIATGGAWAPARAGGWVAAVTLVAAGVLALSWLRGPANETSASEPEERRAVAASPAAPAPARPVGTIGRGTTPPAPPVQEVTLTLTADRPCWVSLTVDGERLTYRTLAPGEQVTARMRQQVSLRAGDAGALRVSANGSDARPVGAAGEVRTITLTPATYRSVLAAAAQ
jgi:cytoskeleton protein RodZ